MTDTPELDLERYALVSCHLPKLTYETLCEHADALHQARSQLVSQIVIEWAMLQRAGAHPTPAACAPDEPPQWRKTHPWYCHTCRRRVSGWEWHSHEPCGRPAEMRCSGHTVTVAVSCNAD